MRTTLKYKLAFFRLKDIYTISIINFLTESVHANENTLLMPVTLQINSVDSPDFTSLLCTSKPGKKCLELINQSKNFHWKYILKLFHHMIICSGYLDNNVRLTESVQSESGGQSLVGTNINTLICHCYTGESESAGRGIILWVVCSCTVDISIVKWWTTFSPRDSSFVVDLTGDGCTFSFLNVDTSSCFWSCV